MSKKENLAKAKKEKNDEFYTQYEDIERELAHYMDHFKDKVVFCNCDDPEWSNFWKYFESDFSILGLKKLIATHYEENDPSYKIELECIDGSMVKTKTSLKGNGDFRNQECVDILKECDIVVTNPPFSLFREYIDQLIEYDKKFLIIGNQNAITYKEIFPLIKNKNIWLGINNGSKTYRIPDNYSHIKNTTEVDGYLYTTLGNTCWFTNLEHKKRHQKHILFRTYNGNESEYPKYDNYDAINVEKSADIPYDYYGVMGVPISFLDKICPEQFEIVGLGKHPFIWDLDNIFKYSDCFKLKGKQKIKTNDLNAQLNISELEIAKSSYYTKYKNGTKYESKDRDYKLVSPYSRLLIKRIDLDDKEFYGLD